MEHDNLYCCGVIHGTTYLDADCRMANVQYLLWQSYLVSYALRFPDDDHTCCHGLLLVGGGRSHQYPAHEVPRLGPQRAYFSFAYDLLLVSSCIDLRECVTLFLNFTSDNFRLSCSLSKSSLFNETLCKR